jgi:YD repeat-containing protein
LGAYEVAAGNYSMARTEHWTFLSGNLKVTGNTAGRTTTYTYNDAGQLLCLRCREPAHAGDLPRRHDRAYDADRRLTSITDPLANETQYAYYENGSLRSLTDPNGNVTSWDIDVEARPTAKQICGRY